MKEPKAPYLKFASECTLTSDELDDDDLPSDLALFYYNESSCMDSLTLKCVRLSWAKQFAKQLKLPLYVDKVVHVLLK